MVKPFSRKQQLTSETVVHIAGQVTGFQLTMVFSISWRHVRCSF